MSRRLPHFIAALFLVTSAAHAASLDAEMKTVEKLRGLTFAHAVVSKTITRAELPKVLRALLEGEATLVMIDYVLDRAGQKLDDVLANPEVLSMLTSSLGAADKTIDASTPRYFAESLKFPYSEGLKLVIEGYRRGGWKMVDRMDENPPRSTREVLHPDEYFARLAGTAAPAVAFDDKSPLSHVLTVEHLGEFHWRFLVGDAGTGGIDDRVTVVQNVNCD